MKRLRIYIDTSVVGGCFDQEFAEESNALFDMARRGEAELIISALLLEELEAAPKNVQSVLSDLEPEQLTVQISSESEELRNSYLSHKVIGETSRNDALHVALATIAGADVIVSWNFKHLVHFEKIRGFNAVNLLLGYQAIEIRSPKEIV